MNEAQENWDADVAEAQARRARLDAARRERHLRPTVDACEVADQFVDMTPAEQAEFFDQIGRRFDTSFNLPEYWHQVAANLPPMSAGRRIINEIAEGLQ